MRKLGFFLIFAICGAAVFGQNSLVLAPLLNEGGIEEVQIRTLTRLLENAIQRTGRFNIIDRGAAEDILREHGFQLSDLSDTRKTAEVGRVLNADYLARPSVMPLAGVLYLEARIVEVNTARMPYSADIQIKADLSDAYEKLGEFAAALTGTAGGGGPPAGYQIGDRGPAGGWVFYDKGVYSNGWRYFEAAPVKMEFRAAWGAFGQDVRGTVTGIGTGKRNTQIIVEYLRRIGENGMATQICNELTVGDYDDWFLPSKDELNLMYQNLAQKGLGEFTIAQREMDEEFSGYWSSSQINTGCSWEQSLGTGRWNYYSNGYKDLPAFVRCIRAF
jgi:hypothetical protein